MENTSRIVIFVLLLLLISSCTPNLVTEISPMNRLNSQKCFVFPSKQALQKSPIYKQHLYAQTYNALNDNNIKVLYGDITKCNNYLLTDWVVNTSKSTMMLHGNSQTKTYSSIYQNTVDSSSTTYTLPSVAYEVESYYGAYILETGVLNSDYSLSTVWKGSQSGKTSRTSVYDAQRVADDFQPLVNKMVKKMLQENNLIEAQFKPPSAAR